MRKWFVLVMVWQEDAYPAPQWMPQRLTGPFVSKDNAEAIAKGMTTFVAARPAQGSQYAVVMESDAP